MAILPDSFEISSRARARNKKGTCSPFFQDAAFLGMKSAHFLFSSTARLLPSAGGSSLRFFASSPRVLGFLETVGGWSAEEGVGFLDLAAAAARALPMRTSATVRRPDMAVRQCRREICVGLEKGRRRRGKGESPRGRRHNIECEFGPGLQIYLSGPSERQQNRKRSY